MVADVDLKLVKLVRRVEEERQARLKAEHRLRGYIGALSTAKRELAAERAKTADSKPKPIIE